MAQEAGAKRAIISTALVTIKCARRRGIRIGRGHAPLVGNGNLKDLPEELAATRMAPMANSRKIMIEETTAGTTTGNAVPPANEEEAPTHIRTATVAHQAKNGSTMIGRYPREISKVRKI